MLKPRKSHGQEGWLAPAEIERHSTVGRAQAPFPTLRFLLLSHFLTPGASVTGTKCSKCDLRRINDYGSDPVLAVAGLIVYFRAAEDG